MNDATNENAATETSPNDPTKPPRGFARLSLEERQAMGARGGRATVAAGKLRRFTVEEAREAGRKGGLAPHVSRGRGARREGAAS